MKLSQEDKNLLLLAINETRAILRSAADVTYNVKDLEKIEKKILKYNVLTERLSQSKSMGKAKKQKAEEHPDSCEPDWSGSCDNCGESPTVPATGLCGPCTFGEADTVGGDW